MFRRVGLVQKCVMSKSEEISHKIEFIQMNALGWKAHSPLALWGEPGGAEQAGYIYNKWLCPHKGTMKQ